MAKVFVIQEQDGKNILPALSFGRPIILLPNNANAGLDPSLYIDTIKQKLTEFTSDDFLLLIGDPVFIGAAVAMASVKTSVVKVLKWDRFEKIYYPIELNLLKR